MHAQTTQKKILADSIFPKTVVYLLSSYHWCNHTLKQNLSTYDITVQQYHVLRILEGHHPEPSTVNVIKSNMIDKMSDASRIIDRLIEKKLVRKSGSQADKRAAEVRLSAGGLKLLEEIDQRPTLAQLIATKLSPAEGQMLNELLEKLRAPSDADALR